MGRICFEVELDAEVVKRGRPCSWTVRYRSVIGWGRATLVTDPSERRRALECLIRKVTPRHDYGLSEEELDSVAVIGIDLEEISGKGST